MTGDLIKIQLCDGTQYSCTGVVDFLQPVLDEYLHDYPEIPILLRGDSGFSTPDLYKQCEENGTSYVIRLKENGILRKKASYLVDELDEITKNNKVDYAVAYGEFMYRASSWPYERRVVCKVEKPENQMVYMYTFVVTNMDSSPEYLIKFYCKRGLMENFIKESKSGFDFASVSSHTRMVNANRLQVHALAYNIFNWFRRLVLSAEMQKQRIDTVRLKLLKIAAKVVHSARYITFKLCSSCPYKNEFYETLSNIGKLFPVFFYRDRKFSERLALSIGMFTRGEVGAGVIFIALGYNLGGPALVISVLTIVLNLILTGIFVLWVKKLALRSYTT